ncbi:S9 family peptidase [Sandarakinorhabdus sp.]|uniref:S9 family peptidase n=1 Tax=Sandarakinorhabdus sp. TaxID=1916663 RepID=UPI00286E8899|nr:S9 family peptidase [Sandarakinorhabdus sp.]
MKSAIVALLLTAAPVMAAAPFEPADLYRLSMVTDPQVSPDGRHVLFTRASFDIQTDRRQGEIWLATLNGSSVDKRLLIGAAVGASGATWSPDGTRIAYVAAYLGKPQLWVMNVASGIGAPVTSGKLAPQGLAWSPDGTRIAFAARAEAPAPVIAGMPKKPDGAVWAADPRIITDYSWRTNDGGYVKPGADHLFVAALDGSAPVQLTQGAANQISGAPDWTPDGKAIVYAAQVRAGNDALSGESDLYRIAAAGGTPQRLTDIDGEEGQPKISPDGHMIAWIGAPKTTKFYSQPGLWVRGIDGGTPVHVTAALDRPVNDMRWAPDGKSLEFLYFDAGLTKVAALPAGGGRPRVMVDKVGGTRLYLPSSGGGWSSASGTYAFTTAETDRPAALGIMRGGKQIATIDFNADWRAGKTIGKLERITWASPVGGLPIEGWVQYPPDFSPDRKYPILLDIHGGPNTDYGPYFSITHQIYAAAGYIVLWSNPRGSIGYGERFANGITPEYGGSYPGADHDDLMAGVDEMLKRPFVDAKAQFISGGSGGGVLTTNAIALTGRFSAAAALRPVTDWSIQALTSDLPPLTMQNWVRGNPWDDHELYWRRSTFSMVGKVNTPTLLITGEADYRTPIAQTEAYYQALKVRGVDAMMVRLPEANHGMGRPSQWLQSNLVVVQWFDKYRTK